MPNVSTIIADEEWLYRYVPASPDTRQNPPVNSYFYQNGKLRLSRTAFNDRSMEPSADRAILLKSVEEAKSSANSNDGVVKIQAIQVRKLSGTVLHDETNGRQHNVIFDKTPIRKAHSKIITEPKFAKGNAEKNRWKAFRELLAIEASKQGWILKPIEN